MKNIFLTLLIGLSPVYAFSQSLEDLKKDFIFEENLTISDENNPDSLEYMLGGPASVLSDSKGNILIADGKYGPIRVFNTHGTYIREFGKSGRGPGEFKQVSVITITSSNQIVVFDYGLFRISIFDEYGNIIETILPDEKEMFNPQLMRSASDDRFAILQRKDRNRIFSKSSDNDYLIHIYDESFSQIISSVAHLNDIIDTNDPVQMRLVAGKFTDTFTFDGKTITVAPFFYNGSIFRYSNINDEWIMTDTLKSYTETDKSYVQYDDYKDVLGKGIAASNQDGDPFAIIMNNESLGIFKKNNGNLLHLGLLKIDGKQKLYASHFSKDGELLAHGEVKNLSPGLQENDYYRKIIFDWMDEKNQLYLIDYEEEVTTIRRGFINTVN
jgi:WD40 repeat protein